MILDDESLLKLKLRHYVSTATPMDLLIAVSKTASILNAIKDALYELPTVLLMIEKGGVDKTASVIEAKQAAIARRQSKIADNQQARALKKHDEELIADAKKYFEPKKPAIQTSLENVSARFERKGLIGLDAVEVETITRDFLNSRLTNLGHRMKSRIDNLESAGDPLSKLVGFIPYVESHQA